MFKMTQSSWILVKLVLYLFFLIGTYVAYPPQRPDPFNLLRGASIFSKIWTTCRQYEIQYTEQRMIKYNYTYDCTCAFFYTTCVIKIY
jgi:hypothetical protein